MSVTRWLSTVEKYYKCPPLHVIQIILTKYLNIWQFYSLKIHWSTTLKMCRFCGSKIATSSVRPFSCMLRSRIWCNIHIKYGTPMRLCTHLNPDQPFLNFRLQNSCLCRRSLKYERIGRDMISWHRTCMAMHEILDKHAHSCCLSDRILHSFRASRSGDWYTLCNLVETSLYGIWGLKIVKFRSGI